MIILTSWLPHRCLQKCTTETHLEKSVRLWYHGPHATIDQRLGFPFVWVGICDFTNSFLLHRGLGDSVLLDERNTSITTSHKSRASNPSILSQASNEIISDSEELWDTDVCFLHIQLMVTNVRLSKIHNASTEVHFESSSSPAKSESWNKPNRQCWAVLPTWQYCPWSLVWWMCEIKRASRRSHALVHFVTDRTSLFTVHKMSVLPIRAKYKHFKQFVSVLLASLQLIQVPLSWNDDHQAKTWNFV